MPDTDPIVLEIAEKLKDHMRKELSYVIPIKYAEELARIAIFMYEEKKQK